MENKEEAKLDLVIEYEIESKKLTGYLKQVIEETPMCYFIHQNNDANTSTYEVRRSLAVTKARRIQAKEDGSFEVVEKFGGSFNPNGTSLVLNIREEEAKELFEAIEAKAKTYTQESFANEQNQVIVDLIKKVNADFANCKNADEYFSNK